MNNQVTAAESKKLAWQCRRGMLELDVILIPFLEQYYPSLERKQREDFSRLLQAADPDLYTWIMGYGQPEDGDLKQIVDTIRDKMQVA